MSHLLNVDMFMTEMVDTWHSLLGTVLHASVKCYIVRMLLLSYIQ